MKKEIRNGLLFSIVLILMMACNKTPVIDKEQIKKEIKAKENEYAATYNAGEMKHIGYYADDATSFAQNQPPLVGKNAIIEYLGLGIDSLKRNNKISFTTNRCPFNSFNSLSSIPL